VSAKIPVDHARGGVIAHPERAALMSGRIDPEPSVQNEGEAGPPESPPYPAQQLPMCLVVGLPTDQVHASTGDSHSVRRIRKVFGLGEEVQRVFGQRSDPPRQWRRSGAHHHLGMEVPQHLDVAERDLPVSTAVPVVQSQGLLVADLIPSAWIDRDDHRRRVGHVRATDQSRGVRELGRPSTCRLEHDPRRVDRSRGEHERRRTKPQQPTVLDRQRVVHQVTTRIELQPDDVRVGE